MWFLTPLSTQSILSPTIKFRHLFLKILDQSWVESITAQSPHIISTTSSKTIQYLQINTINSFIFIIIIIIIPILLYFTCYPDSLQ
jgi:beta-lactamase regulating signal transducer with metallopeptidase domain